MNYIGGASDGHSVCFHMVRRILPCQASSTPTFYLASTSRSVSTSRAQRLPAALSLDHFLQRQRVLELWRDVVRSTKKIPDQRTRNEMRSFARQEFERNRAVSDLTQIRYLVSTGKEQMQTMKRYVEEMGSR